MTYSNFIGSGVSVNGAPLVPGGGTIPLSGAYWYVNSVTGSDGNSGSYDSPLATLAQAITNATASVGDVIVLQAGHAETISAAGGVTVNKAGVFIIGLGSGANRPTFTFSTSTAATFLISAANVTVANIVGVCNIDQLVTAFSITAAGCTLGTAAQPVEWQDPSSTYQAVRSVLTNASGDNLRVNLKVRGVTSGGTSPVNAVRLVGCNDGIINLDFYGRASTAVVEFVTTACSNIEVTGYMYNSGVTDGSKDVIDTVTGSTWFASIYDGAAGASYSGGSAAALAADDISTVASNMNVPSADATTNTLERDVVGNKTDASIYVPGTTKSIAAYAKGTADLQERVVAKAAATMVNGNTIFTVAGGAIKIEALVSECVTANDGTASTLQYSVTPTVGSATTISAASASLASAAAGATVTLAGTALATAALLSAGGPNLIANPGTILCPAGTITMVIGVGSTTGTWKHYMRYKPLATGVTVS